MKYIVVYTQTAFNDIKKLDAVAKKRLEKKIAVYIKNPWIFAKKLINSTIGSYRWRVGNYRIVFDIDKETIIVLRVGHRREIYR